VVFYDTKALTQFLALSQALLDGNRYRLDFKTVYLQPLLIAMDEEPGGVCDSTESALHHFPFFCSCCKTPLFSGCLWLF
jgi:hypothetical protein